MLPVRVWVTAKDNVPSPSPSELEISHWFPLGWMSIPITHVPGTSFALRNVFRVFVAKGSTATPRNAGIFDRFGVHVLGNVLVVKIGQRVPYGVVQLTGSEIDLVDVLLGM